MKSDFVRCIDTRGVQYLTFGRQYLVENRSSDEITVVNDIQVKASFSPRRFILVTEQPKYLPVRARLLAHDLEHGHYAMADAVAMIRDLADALDLKLKPVSPPK